MVEYNINQPPTSSSYIPWFGPVTLIFALTPIGSNISGLVWAYSHINWLTYNCNTSTWATNFSFTVPALINVAQNSIGAIQSGIYSFLGHDVYQQLAVDGFTSTCAITSYVYQPYWFINLGKTVLVCQVIIDRPENFESKCFDLLEDSTC
jgi:hypothetical protein